MVSKYIVAVHNHSGWGNYYKEFDNKEDALKYKDECNCDINTYAWLYKYVPVRENEEI